MESERIRGEIDQAREKHAEITAARSRAADSVTEAECQREALLRGVHIEGDATATAELRAANDRITAARQDVSDLDTVMGQLAADIAALEGQLPAALREEARAAIRIAAAELVAIVAECEQAVSTLPALVARWGKAAATIERLKSTAAVGPIPSVAAGCINRANYVIGWIQFRLYDSVPQVFRAIPPPDGVFYRQSLTEIMRQALAPALPSPDDPATARKAAGASAEMQPNA